MKKAKALTNREIASFCSQVAMLQRAGIVPAEGMHLLMMDTKDEDARSIFEQIYTECARGNTFYEGVKNTELFPNYVEQMIKLGEESGTLDDVLFSLSNYYNREQDMNDNIHNALSYPFIMIGMMLIVVIVLITNVLPIFNQVFIQLGSEMSGFSAHLLRLGENISKYAAVFLGILVALAILYFLASKTRQGNKITHSIMIRIPFLRSFFESVASGRFANGMALTMASGMDTFHGLDLAMELVENKEMEEKIAQCKRYLVAGDNFSEAVSRAGIFSNFYSRMISVGFNTGYADSILGYIADNYDKEANRKLSRIISVLEPTLVILLSLLVGMILLSVILPLMGIMSGIG